MEELVVDGVFIFVGLKPNIDLFAGKLELDKWGYLKTDEDMHSSMEGIYAVVTSGVKNTGRLPQP